MIRTINPVFVEFVPEKLEEGKIYISKTYLTASHNCVCGCGHRVVTPLRPKPRGWRLTEHDGTVTLFPSIGNWSFPCRSHYWIKRNRIVGSYPMSADEIEAIRNFDDEAADRYVDTFESTSGFDSEAVPDKPTAEPESMGVLERLKRWFG